MSLSSGVILLAAGSSTRFGRPVPKQFLRLEREPLFMKSLRVFSAHVSVKHIVVVTQANQFALVHKWIKRLKKKNISLVAGGSFRGASVRNGMAAMPPCDVVLVHDSARPLVSREIIRDVERAAQKDGVALAAWPLPDTLKKGKGTRVQKTIPRANLWLAQTPQGFQFPIAKKCLLEPSISATDDVELAERRGFKVTLVAASPTNMKVTFPTDLLLCQKLV